MPVIVLQLDGLVIEKCVNMGDGQFKEGTWVKIAEEFENNPEHPSLSKFRGVYGRLTKRYHGCWCVKWLSHEEAISQALGQRYVSEGPWQLCKLGSEFHGTWLRFDSVRQFIGNFLTAFCADMWLKTNCIHSQYQLDVLLGKLEGLQELISQHRYGLAGSTAIGK
jgi:hypothetical protein